MRNFKWERENILARSAIFFIVQEYQNGSKLASVSNLFLMSNLYYCLIKYSASSDFLPKLDLLTDFCGHDNSKYRRMYCFI